MALVKYTRRQPRLAFPTFASLAAGSPLDDVEARMRKFFETPLGALDADLFPSMTSWMPAMEITENADELMVSAELPGMDRKDVDISVDDGVLTISGEKTTETKEGDEKKYHLVERNYGSFQRSFTLPKSVEASKISAEFAQGVLKVRLPKSAEVKNKGRKIEIAAK